MGRELLLRRRDELPRADFRLRRRFARLSQLGLETLNLGRLRMASKGLTREGDRLVDLDDDAQLRDGMFMIGEVATLKHEVLSAEDLHRSVTEGASGYLCIPHQAAGMTGTVTVAATAQNPAPDPNPSDPSNPSNPSNPTYP